MRTLLAFAGLVDRINLRIGRLVSWLTLVVVLVSATNAVIRKVFSMSSNAWLELQWYLFGAIFLLAAGYTFLRNEHVRIDVFSQRLTRRTQAWIDVFGVLLFMLPACVLVFWLSLPFVAESYALQEQSSNTGGLIRWPVKLLIPVGFGLLVLAGLSHLIKCIAFLRGLGPDPLRRQETLSSEEQLAEDIMRQQERAGGGRP